MKNSYGCLVVLMLLTVPAFAQDDWKWPEKTRNLQVLPKEWNGQRLRPVMLGFISSLGVGCSHCHVGKPGEPLSTYDFVSDENPNKNRAREMYKMLRDINKHLKNIEPSGDKRVNMWCFTCHAGRSRPMTLDEELGEQYRKGGIDAALAHYDKLRERYYGRGAYDFGESALNDFGYEMLRDSNTAAAIRVFTLNAEIFPESANVWDSLGEGYLTEGNLNKAEECYTKVLKLDPENTNAKAILQKIKERSGAAPKK